MDRGGNAYSDESPRIIIIELHRGSFDYIIMLILSSEYVNNCSCSKLNQFEQSFLRLLHLSDLKPYGL